MHKPGFRLKRYSACTPSDTPKHSRVLLRCTINPHLFPEVTLRMRDAIFWAADLYVWLLILLFLHFRMALLRTSEGPTRSLSGFVQGQASFFPVASCADGIR